MKINYENRDHWHPMLKKLVRDVEDIYVELTNEEPTLTSDYRPGDEGVHGQIPLRGADVRCRDHFLAAKISIIVNTRWQYDPNRRHMVCVIAHGEGDNYHLHCQVHPNTRKV